MHTTVMTDDPRLADQIQAVDESLRKSFAAMPVDDVVREVERSMSELGVDLPDATVRDYAQHVADRADYELVLP
jgi:hypothetical protein